MAKKVVSLLDELDLTLEVAELPATESETALFPVTVTENETATLPVIEPEVEAPSGDNDRQDAQNLGLKIAELEDKLVKIQTDLNTLINKKKKKKDKVKCKCKGKKVDIAKCKCKSKKID